MIDDNSVQSSTPTEVGPDFDAIAPISNPDPKVDAMFAELFPEESAAVEEAPDEAPEEVNEVDEVSEDNQELIPSDDDSNIEAEEQGEEVEEATAQADLPIVDYDEAKNFEFKLRINGKEEVVSIDQIASEMSRARKQSDTLNEVENANAELKAHQEAIAKQEDALRAMNSNIEMASTMGQYDNAINHLNKLMSEAKNNNDYLTAERQLRQVQQQRDEVVRHFNQAEAERAAYAAERLSDFGFGDINTDTQRREAFTNYAKENVPAGLISVVRTNPELMMFVEKARLYDKQATSTKKAVESGKLKGSKKTVRGGAVKSPKAKPKVSTLQSKIDSMFD